MQFLRPVFGGDSLTYIISLVSFAGIQELNRLFMPFFYHPHPNIFFEQIVAVSQSQTPAQGTRAATRPPVRCRRSSGQSG